MARMNYFRTSSSGMTGSKYGGVRVGKTCLLTRAPSPNRINATLQRRSVWKRCIAKDFVVEEAAGPSTFRDDSHGVSVDYDGGALTDNTASSSTPGILELNLRESIETDIREHEQESVSESDHLPSRRAMSSSVEASTSTSNQSTSSSTDSSTATSSSPIPTTDFTPTALVVRDRFERDQSLIDLFAELAAFTAPLLAIWISGPILSLVDAAVVGATSTVELAALGPATSIADQVSAAL